MFVFPVPSKLTDTDTVVSFVLRFMELFLDFMFFTGDVLCIILNLIPSEVNE